LNDDMIEEYSSNIINHHAYRFDSLAVHPDFTTATISPSSHSCRQVDMHCYRSQTMVLDLSRRLAETRHTYDSIAERYCFEVEVFRSPSREAAAPYVAACMAGA